MDVLTARALSQPPLHLTSQSQWSDTKEHFLLTQTPTTVSL